MRNAIYIAATLMLTGCGLYRDYEPQQTDAKQLLRSELNTDSLPGDSSNLKWEEYYTDPQLQALIKEGLSHNTDLAIARLKTDEAAASLREAKGSYAPSLSIGATGGLSQYDGGDWQKTYSIGPEASWEIEIFGKMTNAKKQALANVEERQAYTQAVQTQLIATIATYYYTLEMLDAQSEVTQKTIDSWTDYVKTQTALYQAGQAEHSAITQAMASQLSAQTQQESLKESIDKNENSLCALIGRKAGTIERGKLDDAQYNTQLGNGIALEQITNRPDIRQAEASLKSAYYVTNQQKSAFYPTLTLSGSAGWTNNSGAYISNPGALLLQAAGSLTQPLFNKGKNKANLRIAKAQQEEALLNFQQKVLDAGNEVNNALKTYQTAQKKIEIENQQIEQLQLTLEETQKKNGIRQFQLSASYSSPSILTTSSVKCTDGPIQPKSQLPENVRGFRRWNRIKFSVFIYCI